MTDCRLLQLCSYLRQTNLKIQSGGAWSDENDRDGVKVLWLAAPDGSRDFEAALVDRVRTCIGNARSVVIWRGGRRMHVDESTGETSQFECYFFKPA